MQKHAHKKSSYIIRVAVVTALLWTATLAGLFYWSVDHEMRQCTDLAYSQTRAFYQKFLLTRFWNAMHRGVYVPVTEDSPPNPYLEDDPLRDLETTIGIKLTKLNPAYMTRQISHVAEQKSPTRFHLTALNPINPENAPDQWEREVFNSLDKGNEFFELVTMPGGEQSFRYLSLLYLEQPCMECHERFGDTLGGSCGGISVSIPAEPILASRNVHIRTLAVSYFIIWSIGLSSIILFGFRMYRNDRERTAIIEDLQSSQNKVKQLADMLPICCSCKNIRDDKGYWQRVEEYIGEHADIEFTHGICPQCAKKLYPEFCE